MNQHIQKQIKEELKNIRLAIISMRADMQVQTTDNSKGQIFSAVPTNIVNQWFSILEKKILTSLERVWEDAEKEMIEKLKKFVVECNPDEGQPELKSCYNEWTGELLKSLVNLKQSGLCPAGLCNGGFGCQHKQTT